MTSNPRMKWYLILLGVLLIPFAIVWWPSFRTYPPVSSRESQDAVKLLYTACNTRNPQRLANVEQRVNSLHTQNQMTEVEHRHFLKIIGMAKDGQWERAESEALKFAKDQMR